jgi:Glycosyltransferase family 87
MALALGDLAAQPLRAMRDVAETDYVYAFMTAGRMLHAGTSCLYCPDVQRAARAAFLRVQPTLVNDLYTNPPPAAWLIQPITLLPPRLGLAVFLGLSVAGLVLSAGIMVRRLLPAEMPVRTRLLVAVAAIATLPGAQALAVANWDGLLLLAATGAVWAVTARRPLLAGLLLSTLLVKPQTVWLVPVALAAAGMRRGLAGFAAGALAWAAGSLALVGPRQIAGWFHNLLPAHVQQEHATIGLPGLVAAAAGGRAGLAASAALLVVALACAWRMRRALAVDPAAAVALGLVASALTAPHIWPEDAVLLATPLVVWAGRSLGGALAAAGSLSLAYLGDTLVLGSAGHLEAVAVTGTLLGLAAQLGRRPEPRPPEEEPLPPGAGRAEPELTLTGHPRPASG